MAVAAGQAHALIRGGNSDNDPPARGGSTDTGGKDCLLCKGGYWAEKAAWARLAGDLGGKNHDSPGPRGSQNGGTTTGPGGTRGGGV